MPFTWTIMLHIGWTPRKVVLTKVVKLYRPYWFILILIQRLSTFITLPVVDLIIFNCRCFIFHEIVVRHFILHITIIVVHYILILHHYYVLPPYILNFFLFLLLHFRPSRVVLSWYLLLLSSDEASDPGRPSSSSSCWRWS